MAKMISLLLAFFSLVISIGIGIGIAVAIIVPASGTNLNATVRCFVPEIMYC